MVDCLDRFVASTASVSPKPHENEITCWRREKPNGFHNIWSMLAGNRFLHFLMKQFHMNPNHADVSKTRFWTIPHLHLKLRKEIFMQKFVEKNDKRHKDWDKIIKLPRIVASGSNLSQPITTFDSVFFVALLLFRLLAPFDGFALTAVALTAFALTLRFSSFPLRWAFRSILRPNLGNQCFLQAPNCCIQNTSRSTWEGIQPIKGIQFFW